jgi:hypothetical protein
MWLTLLGWLLDDYVNEYYCLGQDFKLLRGGRKYGCG